MIFFLCFERFPFAEEDEKDERENYDAQREKDETDIVDDRDFSVTHLDDFDRTELNCEL